jgi:hypothetical protein
MALTGDLDASRRAGTGVLRWLAEPVDAASVCKTRLPVLLATLMGEHGCRVFCGLTEGLDTFVLRVYHGDRSLAVFPRTDADWDDIERWVCGPAVLDDIRMYGELTDDGGRRRRR